MLETEILIIGAGLAGLVAAWELNKQGREVLVVEARNRLGGRIHTADQESNRPIELGATWLGSKHTHLSQLLEKLELDTFEQIIGDKVIYEAISTSPPYLASLPPNPEPSLRIVGGSIELINKLAEKLDTKSILLNTKINSISSSNDQLEATSDNVKIRCSKVISTLPPNLLVNTIKFQPQLPANLIAIAKQTHTWMGESIKIALRYSEPFWRKEKSTGTIMSNVGPIPEMYDHSNAEETHFSLMGFLNGAFHSLTREQRLELVKNQLKKYYGNDVDQLISYHETVWRNEQCSYYPNESHVLPHENNGNPIFGKAYLDKNLFLAGTETAAHYPGYMEGAVYSGLDVCKRLLQTL